MRVARVRAKGDVELMDLPEPEPGPGQVRVRMLQCGICGSDLHVYRAEWSIASRIGHEMCAVVERLGAGVSGPAPGTRICAECFSHCGKCRYCVQGDYNLCESISFLGAHEHSGLAERPVLPAEALYPVPDSFSDAQAMMVEPLAVAFRAVSRAGAGPGRSIGIIGAGTIGLLCVAAARAAGASHVAVAAKHAHQAAMARELGADIVAMSADQNAVDALRGEGKGLDAAIDAAARGSSFSWALAVVRNQGRVVLVGGLTRPLIVNLGPVEARELEVTGSQCYATTCGRPDFVWAIELIRSGRVRVEPLVTHTLPLDRVDEAFRIAGDKSTGCIKVAVRVAG